MNLTSFKLFEVPELTEFQLGFVMSKLRSIVEYLIIPLSPIIMILYTWGDSPSLITKTEFSEDDVFENLFQSNFFQSHLSK